MNVHVLHRELPLANSRGIFIFFKYSNIQTSKNIMFTFILLDTFRYCQFGMLGNSIHRRNITTDVY